MQVIEVGVRDQHRIEGGEVGYAQARTAQTFQYEEPACEVRIDDNALAANLHEKTGVANEGDAEFSVGGKSRLVGFTPARSHCRVAYQTSELSGAFAKGRIAKRLLNHSAPEPGAGSEAAPIVFLVLNLF
jgi:hypothetical protein